MFALAVASQHLATNFIAARVHSGLPPFGGEIAHHRDGVARLLSRTRPRRPGKGRIILVFVEGSRRERGASCWRTGSCDDLDQPFHFPTHDANSSTSLLAWREPSVGKLGRCVGQGGCKWW